MIDRRRTQAEIDAAVIDFYERVMRDERFAFDIRVAATTARLRDKVRELDALERGRRDAWRTGRA